MRLRPLLLAAPLAIVLPLLPSGSAGGATVLPLEEADLKIEVNATDGDAGLQIFLDNDAWKSMKIFDPDGVKMADFEATGRLENYGLTELFSESSEPPFTQFPLSEFKALFPEGVYTFRGTTIEGDTVEAEAPLTHDIPDGPDIVEPDEGDTVPKDNAIVKWKGVTTPPGIHITGYQVIVEREEPLRVFQADLRPTARQIKVPGAYLQSGTEYKVEVLAIEESGNQTLHEVEFEVA